MNDLLPCPFCGGDAELWRAHGGRPAWVACMGKCAVLVTREHMTDEDAIAAWNRRTLPAASQPEAEPVAWRSVLEQYQDHLCEGYCKEAGWSDAGHSHPDIQRDCGGCRAAAALLARPTPAPVVPAEGLADYDAGLLNDFGGGDVGWWQDYLRAEIGRANEFWREQVENSALRAQQPAAPVSGVTVQEAQCD